MAVSTFQAVALLAFSERSDSLTIEDICDCLRIDLSTAKRVIHSLACGKFRVLAKTGQSRTINAATDTFRADPKFTSKLRRFGIQMYGAEPLSPPRKEARDFSTLPVLRSTLDGEVKKKVDTEVQHQRTFNIDATCVVSFTITLPARPTPQAGKSHEGAKTPFASRTRRRQSLLMACLKA